MASGGHTTRTLLASSKYPEVLLVSRGSDGNLDYDAQDVNSGKCMIKAFNLAAGREYDYNSDGVLLGWGLRNSVGIGEDAQGGIWAVENSADEIVRRGVDLHEDNPAEEMNFLGYLNETVYAQRYQGPNFGRL
jgi:glucose/arabinose dehydrogenase